MRASITKDQKPGGLSNKNLFLTVLEAEPKIKVPTDLVSIEGSLLCLQMAISLHWLVDSLPLSHQGSPSASVVKSCAHSFGQTPGDGEGQGSLACCNPWDHRE